MAGYIGSKSSVTQVDGYTEAEADAEFVNDPNGAITVSGSNVGIGTSSPSTTLHVQHDGGASNSWTHAGSTALLTETNAANPASIKLYPTTTANGAQIVWGGVAGDGPFVFRNYNTERMRIDSSGNVLVGTTTTTNLIGGTGNDGVILAPNHIEAARDGGAPLFLNRTTSNGDIVSFRQNGTDVGAIGIGSSLYIDGGASQAGLQFRASDIVPRDNGSLIDNGVDLGDALYRFDDVFATNGTIQTSDFNEKQDIASLTATEMLVAKRISALFKTFRWKDSVAEKGDSARTHTGIIAQDVQASFTAEGLDAGDYALFISDTWWEHDVDVPAVEAVAEVTDEDGNVTTEAVEAKDAYTRTDTYEIEDEAPEGATSKTRLGIRYPELLSFVAAYNEQRFASIEARLTALEA